MTRFRFLVLLALMPMLGGCASFWDCFRMLASTQMPSPPVRTSPSPSVDLGSGPFSPQEPPPAPVRTGVFALAEATPFAAATSLADAGPRADATPIAAGPWADPTPIAAGQEQAPYREPQRAFCFACMLAGGGHFYTGETAKGAALLGIAAAGLIGGVVLSDGGSDDPFDCEYDFETHECEPVTNRTPLLVGAGIAAASWAYGIIDARRSAARVNLRNGHPVGATFEMRPVLGLDRGEPGGGLSFRVRW